MPRLSTFNKISDDAAAPAPFQSLLRGHYGTILVDAPLRFKTYDNATAVTARGTKTKRPTLHYRTMPTSEILALPVADLAAANCVMLFWTSGVFLDVTREIICAWGFKFKTVAFVWTKADPLKLFARPWMGQGFWTRSNAELCLLATRGHPKRLHADVSQIIIEPRRQHSRKPDLYDRIERLVAGPYLEMFARQTHPGWTSWGNEITRFDTPDARSPTRGTGLDGRQMESSK
jgi:N6-adenosine-specific RNA methylase IME4